MLTLQAFLAALALSWSVGLVIGPRLEDVNELPRWMPARWIARYFTLQLERPLALFWLISALLLACIGFLLTGFISWLFLAGSLLILGPVALYTSAQCKMYREKANRKFVFFNLSPTIQLKDKTKDKKSDQEPGPLFFYIDSEDWNSLGKEADATREFWERFCIASNLYVAPCTEEILIEIDSLQLNRFLIQPQNKKTMDAFSNALKNKSAALNETDSAVSADKPKKAKGKPLRERLPSLTTQKAKPSEVNQLDSLKLPSLLSKAKSKHTATTKEAVKDDLKISSKSDLKNDLKAHTKAHSKDHPKDHPAKMEDYDPFDDLFDDFDDDDEDDFFEKNQKKESILDDKDMDLNRMREELLSKRLQSESKSESTSAATQSNQPTNQPKATSQIYRQEAQRAQQTKPTQPNQVSRPTQTTQSTQPASAKANEPKPEPAKPEPVIGPKERELQKKQALQAKAGRQTWNPQAQVKKTKPQSKENPAQSTSTPTLESSKLRETLSTETLPKAENLENLQKESIENKNPNETSSEPTSDASTN